MTSCSCHSHSGFLTARGYRAVAQWERERCELDAMADERYLDRVGSMSALVEVEDDAAYDLRHVELNRSTFLQLEIF